jgi:hypothetical protein
MDPAEAFLFIFGGMLTLLVLLRGRKPKEERTPAPDSLGERGAHSHRSFGRRVKRPHDGTTAAGQLSFVPDEQNHAPSRQADEDESSGYTPYSLSLHRFDEDGTFVGKECDTCGQVKWLSDFYPHSTSHDGHENTCLECVNAWWIEQLEDQIADLEADLRRYRSAPDRNPGELSRTERELDNLNSQLRQARRRADTPDWQSQQWIEHYRQRKEAGARYWLGRTVTKR